MMTTCATLNIFELPELVLMLSTYLRPYDLAQCNLVSKAWSCYFAPILWRVFCPSGRHADVLSGLLPPPLEAALIRNKSHIRTVKSFNASPDLLQILANDSGTHPSVLCTSLKRLEFDVFLPRERHLSSCLATILNCSYFLTYLKLPFGFIKTDTVLSALSRLENLQHLTISSSEDSESSLTIASLLQACLPLPSLTELFLDVDAIWKNGDQTNPDLETLIQEASAARFSRHFHAPKITSLHLPTNRFGDWIPLPLAMLQSDLVDLESCQVPCFPPDIDLNELERIVREHCPNLKKLCCPFFTFRERDGPAVRAFIRACSGLRSFVSEYFCDSDFDRDSTGLLRITSEVVSHHYNTLESFTLEYCSQVSSHDQQTILSRCRQLKRFWVMDTYQHDSLIGIAFTDVCKDDWVCMELTELGLTLNRHPREDDAFNDLRRDEPELDDDDAEDSGQSEEESQEVSVEESEEEYDEEVEEDEDEDVYAKARLIATAAKRFYKQIGRLQKLEVLALDIEGSENTNAVEGDYAWDLTLCKGWLGELAGLTNLRSLSLHADLWSKMGQAEVEFMHEHWPLLYEINFQSDDLQWRAQSHWQWLLKRRPLLLLTNTRGW